MIITGSLFIDILVHFILLVVIFAAIRYTITLPTNTFIFACLLYAALIGLVSHAFLPELSLQNILLAIETAKSPPKDNCCPKKQECPTPSPKPEPPKPTPPPCSCPTGSCDC
jgi:hypothetical protein